MSSSAADGWVQVATFLVGRLFATYCMAAGFQYTVHVWSPDSDIITTPGGADAHVSPGPRRGDG